MTEHPQFTKQRANRPYRPRLFWLARTLVFLGFFIVVISSGLGSPQHLDPALWWLLAALILVFTGIGLAHFSTPTPLAPIDVPMKHFGWFFVVMVPGMFILRWFNWDGPQIVLLLALAILIGWWASRVLPSRLEAICNQYRQTHATKGKGREQYASRPSLFPDYRKEPVHQD